MKKNSLIVLALIVSQFFFGQTLFEHITIDDNSIDMDNIQMMISVDVDGDNDDDVIYASWSAAKKLSGLKMWVLEILELRIQSIQPLVTV